MRRPALAVLLALSAACGGSERMSPGTDVATADPPSAPSDPSVGDTTTTLSPPGEIPIDSGAPLPVDTTETLPPGPTVPDTVIPPPPGIVFAGFQVENSQLGEPYMGSVRLPGPGNIVRLLTGARAKGGRLIVKLSNHDTHTKNADGTFSLTKWKHEVDQFRNVDLSPFIKDGTLMGHFLVDEPEDRTNWAGVRIPQATVEEMAKYSKQLWPELATFVRGRPTYLAATGERFEYLDAGWAMYESWKGDPRSFIEKEVAAAKKAKIGIVVGLNVVNGGTKESGIKGLHPRFEKYGMSAKQVRAWGAIMLDQPYACGFYNWKYEASYNARPDIQDALAELAAKARAHAETSCRE